MGEYALRLSDAEVARYQALARRACTEEKDLWRLAGISTGAGIVDLGCGPGAALVTMAEVVGPTGWVTGVDADPQAVDRASEMITHAGLVNARAQLGHAQASGLAAASCDVAMVRHVLAHNGPREQAIVDHAATLVRPGGAVYLLDIDMTAARIWPAVPELTEMYARYRGFHAAQGNDLQAGLRLAALLSRAGLEVITHRGWYGILTPVPGIPPAVWAAREVMIAAGFATPEDLARWEAAWHRFQTAQPAATRFSALFAAIGRRPL